MRILSHVALATAVLLGSYASDASACTVSAWLASNTTATNANAGGRSATPAIPRYFGSCALNTTAAGTVVGDNTPSAEPTFRARFYVFANLTAGASKIFSATSGDNGAGTEVVGVLLQSNGQIVLQVNGTNVATLPAITQPLWYGIEVTYIAGTSASITVRNNLQTYNQTQTVTTGVNTAIESTTIGFSSTGGGVGRLVFDEFESSRGATAIGFLPVGDAEPDGSYTIGDVVAVLREFRLGASGVAAGNADIDGNGVVDLADVVSILRRFRTGSF
jgi:hypothetical protein